jgi:hypothetical protein
MRTTSHLSFKTPVQNDEVDWIVGTGGVSWVILDKSRGSKRLKAKAIAPSLFYLDGVKYITLYL